MSRQTGTLHFICGRLASGKTTLARQIAEREPAMVHSHVAGRSRPASREVNVGESCWDALPRSGKDGN